MSPLKGTDTAPTSRSHVDGRGKAGWPTGREPYGHGVAVVVVGVTPDRGAWASHAQGEGHQGGGRRAGKEARCRRLTCPTARRLESGVLGNLHAPFGGGPTEKDRAYGTSPEAYPTFLVHAFSIAIWHPERQETVRTRKVASTPLPPDPGRAHPRLRRCRLNSDPHGGRVDALLRQSGPIVPVRVPAGRGWPVQECRFAQAWACYCIAGG